MTKHFLIILFVCFISSTYSNMYAIDKKKYEKAVFGDKSREEIEKERDLAREKVYVSATGRELGFSKASYLNPRYNKYSKVITGDTPDPERIFQELEKQRKRKNAKNIATITLVSFLLIVLFKKHFGPSKSDKKIEAVSKYDNNTLTEDEIQIAGVLYELKNIINDPELEDLIRSFGKDAIDEVSFEIFKYGMWRLLDKEYANHLFDNTGYVHAAKQKIINDINKRLLDDDFLRMERSDVQLFVLGWVLKTRDDAKNIRNIMYNLVSN